MAGRGVCGSQATEGVTGVTEGRGGGPEKSLGAPLGSLDVGTLAGRLRGPGASARLLLDTQPSGAGLTLVAP